MNKSDIINAVAKKGNAKYIVKNVIDDVFEEIQKALAQGDKVQIHGFGTFEIKEFKGHPAVHPETKESIIIPSYRNIVFNPSKELKRSTRSENS